MANAIKPASIFLVCFLLFLAVIEVPKIAAHDDEECLKEYEDQPLTLCLALIYPSLCYFRCRQDKKALGGQCKPGEYDRPTCYCDYCSDKPRAPIQLKSNYA
ncbi:PREDICTED: defensin-like protein 194 [Tarenaya hassleriana]|uniref:defensin-like protein 194 n=1 Tax=Tarenaya hassleriana TaxID=28532 RepID=UPI00053C9242|nr:PREDICTED: defensin-like protein 194 [Tarenaya hassleriana]